MAGKVYELGKHQLFIHFPNHSQGRVDMVGTPSDFQGALHFYLGEGSSPGLGVAHRFGGIVMVQNTSLLIGEVHRGKIWKASRNELLFDHPTTSLPLLMH